MFNSIGPIGLVVLIVAAIVIYGPHKLPELGKSLGKTLKAFKNETKGTNQEFFEHDNETDSKLNTKKVD